MTRTRWLALLLFAPALLGVSGWIVFLATNELAVGDYRLQRAYWISQLLLIALAGFAGFVALRQSQHSGEQKAVQIDQNKIQLTQGDIQLALKIHEILENPEVRRAREVIMRRTDEGVTPDWWKQEEEKASRGEANVFADAAARMASSYDHVGSVLHFFPNENVARFASERWGETAIRAYKLKLRSYLSFRRRKGPKSYQGYLWFYQTALEFHKDLLNPDGSLRKTEYGDGEIGLPT